MASIGCEHHRILVLMDDLLGSFSVSALPSGLSGCLVTSGNSLILGVWIILMVYEAGKPSCTSNNKTTSINSFYRYLTVDDIERSPNVYVEGFSWHPIFILIRWADKEQGSSALFLVVFRDGECRASGNYPHVPKIIILGAIFYVYIFGGWGFGVSFATSLLLKLALSVSNVIVVSELSVSTQFTFQASHYLHFLADIARPVYDACQVLHFFLRTRASTHILFLASSESYTLSWPSVCYLPSKEQDLNQTSMNQRNWRVWNLMMARWVSAR